MSRREEVTGPSSGPMRLAHISHVQERFRVEGGLTVFIFFCVRALQGLARSHVGFGVWGGTQGASFRVQAACQSLGFRV